MVVVNKRHDRGYKRFQTTTLLRVIKKANSTGDLTYMRCSAPAPPTMAVKELDLETI